MLARGWCQRLHRGHGVGVVKPNRCFNHFIPGSVQWWCTTPIQHSSVEQRMLTTATASPLPSQKDLKQQLQQREQLQFQKKTEPRPEYTDNKQLVFDLFRLAQRQLHDRSLLVTHMQWLHTQGNVEKLPPGTCAKVIWSLTKLRAQDEPELWRRLTLTSIEHINKGHMTLPDLARIVYSYGQFGRTKMEQLVGENVRDLFKVVSVWVEWLLRAPNPQDGVRRYAAVLVKIALGFLNCRMRAQDMFMQLAKAADTVLDDFTPGELVNLLRAFAVMGVDVPDFLDRLLFALRPHASKLYPMQLHTAVSALARVSNEDEVLLSTLTKACMENLSVFTDEQILKVAKAYKIHGGDNAKLIFEALSFHLVWKLHEIELNTLLQFVVSFDEAGISDTLWKEMASAIAGRTPIEQPVGLTKLMWVLARLPNPNDESVGLITQQVVLLVDYFNSSQLATVVWACGKLKVKDNGIMAFLLGAITKHINEFAPPDLTKIVWACSELGLGDMNFWEALSAVVAQNTSFLAPSDLSTIALAYATMDLSFIKDSPAVRSLFEDRLTRACDVLFDDLRPPQLVDLAWSFVALGIRSDTLFVRIAYAASNFQNTLHNDDSTRLTWALQTYVQEGELELPLPATRQEWPGLRTLDSRVASLLTMEDEKRGQVRMQLGLDKRKVAK